MFYSPKHYSPKHYSTMEVLRSSFVRNGISDTIIDGIEIFGYLNGVPYAVKYEKETEFDDDFVAVAGRPL